MTKTLMRKFARSLQSELPDGPKTKKFLEEGSRELQVVVGGFGEATEGQHIIAMIEKFLSGGGRRAQVSDVGTFADPAQVGFIEF